MKLKVLYVTQEITPYLPETELSKLCRYLPQGTQELDREIRTFMPRFGCINERRNQLHEVIRLSGMNLIIDDVDHQLVIKVASIQPARLQTYFIDNEDFFSRKSVFCDKGKEHKDNDERAIFYSRGVIETVKKLCWAPDIIHCHGWFTALVPFFIKKIYQSDPLFDDNLKIIYSVYDDSFSTELNNNLINKLNNSGLFKEEVELLQPANWENLTKFAISHSDAVIFASNNIDDNIQKFVSDKKIPFIVHSDEDYIKVYNDFYDKLYSNKL